MAWITPAVRSGEGLSSLLKILPGVQIAVPSGPSRFSEALGFGGPGPALASGFFFRPCGVLDGRPGTISPERRGAQADARPRANDRGKSPHSPTLLPTGEGRAQLPKAFDEAVSIQRSASLYERASALTGQARLQFAGPSRLPVSARTSIRVIVFNRRCGKTPSLRPSQVEAVLTSCRLLPGAFPCPSMTSS